MNYKGAIGPEHDHGLFPCRVKILIEHNHLTTS
jgi:hypothetical protein